MNDILYMAWRYLRYHWIKTCVLLASISLVLFLPLGLQVVVQQGADTLTSRAASTPLLIGAQGSAVDLALAALYFRDPTVDPVPYREVTRVNQSGLAAGIPLHLRFRAGRHRIVGTTTEYFELRGLVPSAGRAMAMLGECVLGANAARKLGVQVGGYVLSTPAGAFDVAGTFPLKMKVVGILALAGTPDDEAVFTDIKTAWVIAGLAHGHMDMLSPRAESGVLRREDGNLVANPAVLSYTEITPDNLDSFHFHGDPDEFPVDAILAAPYDRKSSIMLRGRYEAEETDVQMLVPMRVINGSAGNGVLGAGLHRPGRHRCRHRHGGHHRPGLRAFRSTAPPGDRDHPQDRRPAPALVGDSVGGDSDGGFWCRHHRRRHDDGGFRLWRAVDSRGVGVEEVQFFRVTLANRCTRLACFGYTHNL